MFWLICVRQLCDAYVIARKVNNKTTELPTLIATVINGQTLGAVRLVLVRQQEPQSLVKCWVME